MENQNNRIDYIEFPAVDIAATKKFYTAVFGWKFTDYGPDYVSFEEGRLSGGFEKAASISKGGPLVVLFSSELEKTRAAVTEKGGTISKAIFTFPGGRIFHFLDATGNDFASEK